MEYDLALRAIRRARQRGWKDILIYSCNIAWRWMRGAYIDMRYGKMLARVHSASDSERYSNMPMNYYVLRAIFDQIAITPDDVLVDVGCGDGRVLNFWLSRYQNRLIGIEIDAATAASAIRRYRHRLHVKIIHGDAAQEAARSGGTVFLLYNPFGKRTMDRFEQSLRSQRCTIVYYNYSHLDVFENGRWQIQQVEKLVPHYCQYRVAFINPL